LLEGAVDDADWAQERIERELELVLTAAELARDTGASARWSRYCDDCDEELLPHRQEYGRCVPCQARRELTLRRDLVGV
jgi:hypothetical protein